MLGSLSLGHVREVEVKLHPTFGLVVLWAFYNWGAGVPGIAAAGAALFGLFLVCCVFGCVLLHELGHSFMAIQYGHRVRDVTLSVIGGVARIEYFPTRPRSEMMIALAGPAVNVAIMVALLPLLLLYGVLRGFDSPADYVGALGRLDVSAGGLLLGVFYANALIAVFNLLPAFPMDGGRVLRAALTVVVGRERGTRTAVLVGQGLAIAFAAASLIWLRNPVAVLIAVFVVVMAQAEGRAVRLEGAMRRLRVGQFALWDMGGIDPKRPLTDALRGGPRDVAVTDHGRVVGMLWRHDLLHALRGGGHGMTVAQVMDRELVTAEVDDSVFDVQQQMNRLNRWAIPVVEEGQYRGLFTADRFVHVYHQLAPSPLAARQLAGLRDGLRHRVRGWIR